MIEEKEENMTDVTIEGIDEMIEEGEVVETGAEAEVIEVAEAEAEAIEVAEGEDRKITG